MRLVFACLLVVLPACTLPEATLTESDQVSSRTAPTPSALSIATTPTTSTESPTSVALKNADGTALILIEPEHDGGYERKLFKHWSDVDKDGCDTRREVLIEESLNSVTVGIGCLLEGGRWHSVFDGVETSDPSTFDVDHMVPLKEAWDSGAWAWDSDLRQEFANDMSIPESLVAVSASSNRSKGAKDPAEWMPPLEDFHCSYVAAWIAVKQRWALSMDQAEYDAISDVRRRC